MVNLKDLTVDQLRKAAAIKEQIEQLQQQLETIENGRISAKVAVVKSANQGKRSYTRKAKITDAANKTKARLIEEKALIADSAKPTKKRKGNATANAKRSAAAKARWAKIKAEGKTKL